MIQGKTYTVHIGSNLDILPTLSDNSVDSIVTDPPYGLSNNKFVADTIAKWISGERDFIPDGKGFMGKSWDAFVPPPALWDECLRVLKPGGHLLAFFGSRTQDIGALSIRLAGFEIRDSIAWMYGSGFPKSLDISKAIDKAAGAEREVLTEVVSDLFGDQEVKQERKTGIGTGKGSTAIMGDGNRDLTAPATPEAQQWEGWGTALKPAFEPIVVARKPLIGTVAENVLTHGTGGLNIDGSRIGTEERTDKITENGFGSNFMDDNWQPSGKSYEKTVQGRWPANVILDPYTAELLDEQSGQSGTSTTKTGEYNSRSGFGGGHINIRHPDSGGASRFFYVAKASKRDRNEGLEELEAKSAEKGHGRNPDSAGAKNPRAGIGGGSATAAGNASRQNFHPTVKPTDLMRYLVKLVTPPGGIVLDPFTGSGSTGKAAILEGFRFIGCELTEDYIPIIEGRLAHAERVVAEQKEKEDEALF